MDTVAPTLPIGFPENSGKLKYALLHAAYWILITAFFIYEKKYMIVKAGLPSFAACIIIRIALLIAIAYINLHYLLPKYLLTGRYWRYFLFVLLSVAGYLLLQALFDIILYGYVLGPMRRINFWETVSYNFFSTLWYIGIVVAFKLSIDWYEQKRILQRVAFEKLQAEVNYLRAQVNPHFLFNVLNNLYSLTLKKSDKAPDVVLKLSTMMEYMLYDSDEEQVSLEKEIAYLQNYIALEQLRYGENVAIHFDIKGEAGTQLIAPLLFLPLVENAFKHSVSKTSGRINLNITMNITESSVFFNIENDKPTSALAGIAKTKGGIGLHNLRQRLELLYPGKHVFDIKDDKDKFTATLQINF